MEQVTNAVNAVCGKFILPMFVGESDNRPYIGRAFWDSLNLRDDLFPAPETRQVVHNDQRMNRTEFIRVSTVNDVVQALHRCRGYIRYFEYIKDEDLDTLVEALEHYLKDED